MKYSKQDPRLLEAKFKFGNVLLGLAMLHDAEKGGALKSSKGSSEESDGESEQVQETIRRVSSAIAPVLIPVIDQLSGLSEEHLEEISKTGEDV
jgi:hypothetical protein